MVPPLTLLLVVVVVLLTAKTSASGVGLPPVDDPPHLAQEHTCSRAGALEPTPQCTTLSPHLLQGYRCDKHGPLHLSRGLSRCGALDAQLVAATVHVVKTVVATYAHLVFQGDSDVRLLEGLWASGVGVVVMEEGQWWRDLQHLSYSQASQHVLVGDLQWIVNIMAQVRGLYASNSISALKTHWFWVCTGSLVEPSARPPSPVGNASTSTNATASTAPRSSVDNSVVTTTTTNTTRRPSSDSASEPHAAEDDVTSASGDSEDPQEGSAAEGHPASSKRRPTLSTPNTPPVPPPNSAFTLAMDDLSPVLLEGMRGLLLAQVRRRTPPSAAPHEEVHSRASLAGSAEDQQHLLGTRVMVGGVDVLVDGRWRLRRAASWADGRLQVYAPLWPTPPWNLHRRLVRFTCHNKPTVFTMRAGGGGGGGGLGSAEGYLAELMREMGRRLNFTSALIPTEGFGSLTASGSWNGMVGVIASGEADVAPLDFTPSVERLEVVDFSRPLGQDVVVILAQAPAVLVRPFLLLQIYSPQMWGCVLGGAMLVGLVMARLAVLEAEMDGQPYRRNVYQHLISSLSILVYQSSTKWPTGVAGRLLASLMMVVSLVVGSLYCGSITAFLAIPFRSEPVNSLEDLVARDVVPVVRSKVTVYNFLKKQDEGLLGEVKSRMRALSGEDIGSWSFFRKVADGTHALVDTHSGAVGRARSFERRGTRCRFHLARKPVKVDLDTIVYARNSFIKTQFNEIIKWFTYFGIVEKMKKPYYSIPCEANLRSDHPQAMTLQQTQGAFYVLAVGLLTASFVLVVETIGSLCRKAAADTGTHRLTPAVVRHRPTPVVSHLLRRPPLKRAF